MDEEYLKKLLEKYPFISYLTYGGNGYVGIIQNMDDIITTIYDFSALRSDDQKCRYLELGEEWWWHSNRIIPVNVFLKQDWAEFRCCLKTMNSKDVKIQFGPCVSLKEIAARRSKRRSITLVKKVN